jgi:CheY-like chemotaxis protein
MLASVPRVVAPCAVTGAARPLSVLIADDDPDSRTVYGQLFRHVGFEVVEAADARTALDLVHRACPDAVVCELLSYNDDEPSFVDVLRAEPAMLNIPIIVVTSWLLPADEVRAVAAGCSRFLSKPCTPTMLLRELCAVLSRPMH